jgi:hypothetical protein
MADYVKATNFTSKDTLPTGNAAKIIKGAEIDTEFTAIASAISSKADINSPNLTGTPTAPTASAGTNTTQLANLVYVNSADALKANLASPALTGIPTAPTASAGTSTTQLATTAFVTTADNLKADIASPAFTGIPTAPTATTGTVNTQIATTAFVATAIAGGTGALGLGTMSTQNANNVAITGGTISGVAVSGGTITGLTSPLATASGGVGTTATTGTGSNVFSASPALTGTPTAPTASAGTNTTQLATTAFVIAALQAVYPVGSIYINATSATNPATLLGFGTWTAFGAGRVMVGLDASDALFDTAEETGGSKDAITVAHTHTVSGTSDSAGAHQHIIGISGGQGSVNSGNNLVGDPGQRQTNDRYSESAGTHSHTITGTAASTGSSGTNANVQPYITVRMWKRTV